MEYVAEVAAVFSAGKPEETLFDLWTVVLSFEADTPTSALRDAVSLCRKMLDAPPNWQTLGYTEGPTLYAVNSLASSVKWPSNLAFERCFFMLKFQSISRAELDLLTSFNDVPSAIRAIYVEGGTTVQ